MSYIGNTPESLNLDGGKDLFIAGTHYTKNVSTSVTLSAVPAKPNSVKVFFNGVYQNKDTYYLVGSTINFGSVGAPDVIDTDSVEVQYEIPGLFVGLTTADQAVLTDAVNSATSSANTAVANATASINVATALSAPGGSALVGYDGGTVQDVLDSAKPMANYTTLRAYTGRATTVRITTPGIAGFFTRRGTTGLTDNGGTVIIDAGGRAWERVFDGDYLDSWWQPEKDGVTDDTAKYQAIASVLPESSTLKIVGAGTRIISSTVTFAQVGLTVVCDQGAKFKQKDSTLSLNQLLIFSGVGVTLQRLDVDGNIVGNPTVSYTGRGELVKVSGALSRIEQITLRNTHVANFSCGLLISGKDAVVDGVKGYGTGRVAIHDVGDRTIIRNVRCLDIQAPSGGLGNKVIAKDGSSEAFSTPFTFVDYENIYGHSTMTGHQSLIVVDDSLNVGGLVRARGLVCDFPNATGPDVIKFVNVRRVDIDGLTTYHAGDNSSNASLRFQENVSEVNLTGLDLAGHINFDTTNYVRTTVNGNCRIGRDLVGPVCIDDYPDGYLSIADGVVFQNFNLYAIATNISFPDAVISLGECVYNGAITGTPSSRNIVNHRAYGVAGVKRRLPAGKISVRKPIEITNTRTFDVEVRWIGLSDVQDSACIQGNDGRIFVVAAGFTTNGPNGVEGWKRGMEFYNRVPLPGASSYIFVCTTSGASCTDLWGGSIAYTVGTWRVNGANVYVCATAGTSAASGGPTGTGTGIVDGTCTWDYVDVRAIFKAVGGVAA